MGICKTALVILTLIICAAIGFYEDIKHWFKTSEFCFLYDKHAWWVGCHYSPYNKRYCINLLPFLTICIVRPGGHKPN